MAIEQLVIGTFTQTFNKLFYDELVVGKLAHTEFKHAAKLGDEVDVLMPGTAQLFNYAGGDLPDAEEVTNSATKIRIDRAKAFHFELSEFEKRAIEKAPDLKQKVNLIKEYSSDAVKQFAACVDEAYADLYTRAGIAVDNGSTTAGACKAIRIEDEKFAKDIFAFMAAKFKRGDSKGHNNWVDGQMVAIIPPEYQFYLGKLEDYQYVESGHKKMEKGYIGKLAGWDIVVSNNIATYTETTGSAGSEVTHTIYQPLFGIKGKTLAGGVSDNLSTKSYMPEKNFNTRYKGYGVYGVGAPRADFLGTVKIECGFEASDVLVKKS